MGALVTAPLLVVAHEATRTGSPRVLLELLRFAAGSLDVPVAVRVLRGGPLSDDFAALSTAAPFDRPSAIFANSATAAAVLDAYPPSVPSAVYVHEEGAALAVLDAASVRGLTEVADRVLCVSGRARDQLVAMGVDESAVVVVPPLVSVETPAPAAVAGARQRLCAGPDDRLVIGCGEGAWRKGTDLFVQVAAELSPDQRMRFAWIGRCARAFARVLEHDAARFDLADRFTWVDEVADAAPFLAAADLVVVPSREDPQPLVPMEAALLGTPSVGLAVGGVVDFAARGAMCAVDYPDLVALASECRSVLDDPDLAARLVERGRAIATDERSLGALGPLFLAELRWLCSGRSGAAPGSDAPPVAGPTA